MLAVAQSHVRLLNNILDMVWSRRAWQWFFVILIFWVLLECYTFMSHLQMSVVNGLHRVSNWLWSLCGWSNVWSGLVALLPSYDVTAVLNVLQQLKSNFLQFFTEHSASIGPFMNITFQEPMGSPQPQPELLHEFHADPSTIYMCDVPDESTPSLPSHVSMGFVRDIAFEVMRVASRLLQNPDAVRRLPWQVGTTVSVVAMAGACTYK